MSASPNLPPLLAANPRLDRWVRFPSPGHVTVSTGRVEIGEGVRQLTSSQLAGRDKPEKIEGIQANRAAKKLHFLHGTGYSTDDGTVIGKYVIHYEDQTTAEVDLGPDLTLSTSRPMLSARALVCNSLRCAAFMRLALLSKRRTRATAPPRPGRGPGRPQGTPVERLSTLVMIEGWAF